MTNRKLATIRRIKDLLPIKGADRIELAIVDGWQVVTQKGQHVVGDLVVFYEIDSFLPASDPRYASFADRFHGWGDKQGMRLKTIKLRKQLSQGLIMPAREFPEVYATGSPDLYEGMDVTDILKIEKWEPIEKENTQQGPGSSAGKRFPAFIRKTDQERIQNYGAMVERALDEEFEVTMKKDGSSLSVFRVDPVSPYYADAKLMTEGKPSLFKRIKQFVLRTKPLPVYGICSRNVLLPLEGNSNFHKAAVAPLKALRSEHMDGMSYAFQGEVVAPDIQDNYEKVTETEFHLFDIFDITGQAYLWPSTRQVLARALDVPHVKIVDKGTLRDILRLKDGDDVVKACLTYASGEGDNPGVQREGVVFKAAMRDFSFKAVSNEYLLATGK
jgi:RNA ligase (TIGR02306 family)